MSKPRVVKLPLANIKTWSVKGASGDYDFTWTDDYVVWVAVRHIEAVEPLKRGSLKGSLLRAYGEMHFSKLSQDELAEAIWGSYVVLAKG